MRPSNLTIGNLLLVSYVFPKLNFKSFQAPQLDDFNGSPAWQESDTDNGATFPLHFAILHTSHSSTSLLKMSVVISVHSFAVLRWF
jgi:hypothetical protein